MEERLNVALELAKQAGDIILENFDKRHDIEIKDDASPVTMIDKQINSLVASALKKAFPEDGLLGEEESYGKGDETYQWICDPIDGTKPFILGIPLSVFMLGVSRNGQMLLSVVYSPHNDKLYRAVRGSGAFCNDQPIHVNTEQIHEGYALVSSNSLAYVPELKKQARGIEPVAGTGYKCMMIASGYGLGMINASADFHDIGPGSLIIEEAGGKVTGLDGETLDYSKEIGGIIASNGVVHDEFVEIAGRSDQ